MNDLVQALCYTWPTYLDILVAESITTLQDISVIISGVQNSCMLSTRAHVAIMHMKLVLYTHPHTIPALCSDSREMIICAAQ